MFITREELKSVAYQYQIDQILNEDESIAEMAMLAAVEEMKSYLANRYNCNAIFNATNTDRNQLVVEICKDIALWHIIRLSNVDMLYDRVKERYDRAIDWLDKVAKGSISPNLPLATNEAGEDLGTPIRYGSMPRQTYDY